MTKFDIVIYCLRICGLEFVVLRNLVIGLIQGKAYVQFNFRLITLYQSHHEKTSIRGFRPGSTQSGMYSHRRWLEA